MPEVHLHFNTLAFGFGEFKLAHRQQCAAKRLISSNKIELSFSPAQYLKAIYHFYEARWIVFLSTLLSLSLFLFFFFKKGKYRQVSSPSPPPSSEIRGWRRRREKQRASEMPGEQMIIFPPLVSPSPCSPRAEVLRVCSALSNCHSQRERHKDKARLREEGFGLAERWSQRSAMRLPLRQRHRLWS